MEQKNNILNELNILNSQLGSCQSLPVYVVPEGYFDGLPALMLSRVKALQASTPAEELQHLSVLLPALSRQTPYAVPSGYFDGLAAQVLKKVQDEQPLLSVEEELNGLSPLLSGLGKQMPFSVPPGYFDTVAAAPVLDNQPAKVVSLTHRTWFRVAAAAVVTAFIAGAAFFYFRSGSSATDPGTRVLARVTKDVNKMNDEQVNSLIDFLDAGLDGRESAKADPEKKTNEVKDLLKGISDQELKDFEQQSEDIEDVMLTN